MTNNANSPTEIMDWIHSTSFNNLTPAQQTLVLQYFTQEEYTAMVEVLQVLQQSSITSSKQRIKSNLLTQFDKKHPVQPSYNWMAKSIPIWKAAAVLLVLVGVGYFNYTTSLKQLANTINRIHDTVYVERLVQGETIKVIDTVYADRPMQRTKKGVKTILHAKGPMLLQQTDISIQSIKNIDAPANRTKRNSISDDTLINNYRFTTL